MQFLRVPRAAPLALALLLSVTAALPAKNLFQQARDLFRGPKKGGETASGTAPVARPVKGKAAPPASRHFFDFNEAVYYTSPDKRIGVKMLVDSAKVGPAMAVMQHVTLLPGGGRAPHRHVFGCEEIFVIKGALTLRIDDEIKVLGANTCAYVPPKAVHEYKNDSQDVVQFLQIYAPSGPEEEYRNWEKTGGAEAGPAAPRGKEPPAGAGTTPETTPPPAKGVTVEAE